MAAWGCFNIMLSVCALIMKGFTWKRRMRSEPRFRTNRRFRCRTFILRADRLDDAGNVFYEICEKDARSGLGWQRLAWIESIQEKNEQAWYHYKRAERLYKLHDHVGHGGLSCRPWRYCGKAPRMERG